MKQPFLTIYPLPLTILFLLYPACALLARIIHESRLAPWTIRPLGFDCGLFRPPLRASLERVRSTLSKPATKIFNLLRVLIHESWRFVN